MYCTLKWCVHLRGQTHSLIAIHLLGQVQLMVIAWPTESRMADQGIVARMKMLSDAVAGGGHSMLSTTAALNLESRSLPSAEHLRGENLHNMTSTFEKSPLHGQYQTCLSELWGEATSLESLRHVSVCSLSETRSDSSARVDPVASQEPDCKAWNDSRQLLQLWAAFLVLESSHET